MAMIIPCHFLHQNLFQNFKKTVTYRTSVVKTLAISPGLKTCKVTTVSSEHQ